MKFERPSVAVALRRAAATLRTTALQQPSLPRRLIRAAAWCPVASKLNVTQICENWGDFDLLFFCC
ncbi:hypothetical protein L6R21_19865, partial [bacterium]|nr:hypothetical protein [bacterium]